MLDYFSKCDISFSSKEIKHGGSERGWRVEAKGKKKKNSKFMGHVLRPGKLEHIVTTGKTEGKKRST